MTSIFITGIGRGIGYEMARQCLNKGWQIAGSVRTKQDKQRIEIDLPGVNTLVFDVRDHVQIDAAIANFQQSIDILVNNAGIIGPERQSTLDMDFDGFSQTLAVNTIAPLKITQAFLPNLRRGDNPRLATISSQMGRMHYAKSSHIAYRASKSAIDKIMQCLAAGLNAENICVVALNPGWVRTDMGGSDADISVEESAAGILNVIANLSMKDTGQFIDWDGTRQDW